MAIKIKNSLGTMPSPLSSPSNVDIDSTNNVNNIKHNVNSKQKQLILFLLVGATALISTTYFVVDSPNIMSSGPTYDTTTATREQKTNVDSNNTKTTMTTSTASSNQKNHTNSNVSNDPATSSSTTTTIISNPLEQQLEEQEDEEAQQKQESKLLYATAVGNTNEDDNGDAVNNNNNEDCLSQHSNEWLSKDNPSNRLGNIPMSKEEFTIQQRFLSSPLLENIDSLLNQTLALSHSRLVQSSLDEEDTPTTTSMTTDNLNRQQERWLIRLCYAIIYHHQNPRRLKQSSLKSEECRDYLEQNYDVGRWDEECSTDQKFIAFSFQDQGIGAGTHLWEQCLFAGIASQRIVLPINYCCGGIQVAKSWTMASCQRKDIQCVFSPLSNCVLTKTQLNNGTIMEKKPAIVSLYQTGKLPENYPDRNSARIVWQKYENYGLKVEKSTGLFINRMYSISQQLIQELSPVLNIDDHNVTTTATTRRQIWERTAELIRQTQHTDFVFKCFRRAAIMYLLRPNPSSRRQLQEILHRNIPELDSLHEKENLAYKTIGLPIRASDKCKRESTCMPLVKYMELARETWRRQIPNETRPNLIITSESQSIFDQLQSEIIDNPTQRQKYPFQFIVNTQDIHPGSGRFRSNGRNVTADDGMISAMSTLQLQLNSGIVRGNCCSKFHSIIGNFIEVGGGGGSSGAAQEHPPDFQCLNDPKYDPRYRICCWQSSGCKRQREKDLAIWMNQTSSSN